MSRKIVSLLLVMLLVLGTLSACSTEQTPAEKTTKVETKKEEKEDKPEQEESKQEESETAKSDDQKTDSESAADGEPIEIGMLAPLTGSNAEYGIGFQIAGEMAIEEINAAGGINGRPLKIVVADSKGESKESTALTTQFGENKNIMAIIGDFTSGASMADAPIAEEYGIVLLSPTASNPDYAAMSPYAFSIMGRQDGEGPFFARYILGKKLGAKKVGVIYINSDWGLSSYNALTGTFEEVGLELVSQTNYVDGESDFSSVVAKVRAGEPDTIVILDQGNVPKILNEVKKSGWTDVTLTSLGPGASAQLIELSGDAAENLYISTPFFFDPANEKDMLWAEEFQKRSGFSPTVHPVVAYDSVYLIAESMRAVEGELTREAIREALQNIDHPGMAGPIRFNESGDITRQYLIAKVKDGKWALEEGYDYADDQK
ncbi:MAG: ABC transporter substrate-binding protein [Eubacteriales bacterium]|nr:ABC transporter substrate-binding protein [Eubacteriales bacterium]